LYKEAASHFEYYWRKLDPQDQYVLAALPLLHRDKSYQVTIERLKDACLIAQRNGKYGYFSSLLETFVRNQQVDGLRQANPLLVDERRKRVLLRDKPLDLSPTSYELLRYLVQRIGEVISYEELWQAAWSEEPHNVVEQVKSGIKSLRNALDDDAGCIINRRGVGYMLQPPSE
jgi:DNA-binding response OmpR family regulator